MLRTINGPKFYGMPNRFDIISSLSAIIMYLLMMSNDFMSCICLTCPQTCRCSTQTHISTNLIELQLYELEGNRVCDVIGSGINTVLFLK